MPVISFWGNSEKETGQTISVIAVSTLMAIEHNYKILSISTGFKDNTMNDSFWSEENKNSLQKMLGMDTNSTNVESGVEGLSRLVESNRMKSGIITNYAKVVFKDRLDVLPSPKTRDSKMYIDVAKTYESIISTAKTDYNYVFVDVDKRMPAEIQKNILLQSDIIVVTISQTIKDIEKFLNLKEQNELFSKNNIIVLIGKYDRYSKYNAKNVTRYLREKRMVSAVSYNTLFFESTAEGKVADYFLRYRNIQDKTDKNAIFLEETKKTCDNILYKVQEMQLTE